MRILQLPSLSKSALKWKKKILDDAKRRFDRLIQYAKEQFEKEQKSKETFDAWNFLKQKRILEYVSRLEATIAKRQGDVKKEATASKTRDPRKVNYLNAMRRRSEQI